MTQEPDDDEIVIEMPTNVVMTGEEVIEWLKEQGVPIPPKKLPN